MARQDAPFTDRLRLLAGTAAFAFVLAGGMLAVSPALALSELPQEELPVPDDTAPGDDLIEREQLPPPTGTDEAQGPEEEAESEAPQEAPDVSPPPAGMPVPLPDPIVIPQDPPKDAAEAGETMPAEPVPQVQYDVTSLPEPVLRLRQLIMDACLSGDIEQLRPLLGTGEEIPQLSFGNVEGDAIEFLKSLSGDGEGQEILAILYEVLAAGYVHLDAGEESELYVWPYFFAVPLDALTAPQRVELFKLVTAGDYEDMKNFGAYIFYRVGISPEGRWLFFVAGD